MPDAPGPSWKHTGGQAARPASSRKSWQPGRAQATRGPVDPRKKYRRRLVMAAVSGAILVGLIVAVIRLLDPVKEPTLVVVAPDAPESTVVPINAAGAQVAKELAESAAFTHRPVPAAAKWYEAIDNSSGPLVLHFACPGAGDKGGPFLWLVPADAAFTDPGHRLTISEVLNRLKEIPKRQKLLILDAATESVSWTRGQLHNDFARRLKALDSQIKSVPNLVVICSADADQRSWMAEEWRNTAFGHYLLEGLRGAGAAESNARITALDLFKYVHSSVTQWAQANRDADQKPILLPTPDSDPASDGEARAAKILVATLGPNRYQARLPGEAPGRSFTMPDSLARAWAHADELANQSPNPATKAPHVWRQYLDLLLRAEEIARITGEVPAGVSVRLTQLERDLAAPPWKAEPACIPFSLPAGPALGYPRPSISGDDFNSVWAEEDAKRNEAWNARARRLEAEAAPQAVRLAGAAAMLDYLATRQRPDKPALDRAAALLQHVDVGQPRPVETHLLRTLQRHVNAPRDPDLLRLALGVQVDAERTAWFVGSTDAYPYAEQVGRWFAKDLFAADDLRRKSTDFAFAGDAKSADAARTGLEDSRKRYKEIADNATTLGKAYRLRDQILSRLPYYARWAACRRIPAATAQPTLDLVERTALVTHDLVETLENPDPAQFVRVTEMVQQLDGIAERPGLFRKLETEFSTFLGTLGSEALPSNWHAIDNALTVPFIPSETRKQLVEKLRSISRRLNESADPGERVKSAPVLPVELAQRQGRMALAVLGRRQVTDLQGTAPLGWQETKQHIDAPDLGAWWDSMAVAGERIGTTFVAMRGESARLAARADSAAAPADLTRAARYARLADGATILSGNNPVAIERRYWTHALLIGMAERAAADGWADLDAVAEQPYCLLAANRYLDSAAVILLEGEPGVDPRGTDPRLAAVRAARQSLKAPEFQLVPPPPLTLTDQSTETVAYRVNPLAGATGNPVLRLRSVTPPLESREYPTNEYRPVEGFTNPRTEPVAGSIRLAVTGAATGSKGEVVLDLLYRGQLNTKTIPALYEGTPTYRWIYRPPTGLKASFAIKGDEALRNGAVAFLIDLSDSMNIEDKITKKSRFQEAAEGLKKVLADLPPDTHVSVSFFASMDSKRGIQTRLAPIRWEKNKTDAVYDLVMEQKRDGEETPIADAIGQALKSKDIFPGKEFTGFRNLVVITDGADNVAAAPGNDVVSTLQNLPQDVGLHLVLFGISDREYLQARKQFDTIENTQHYERLGRTPARIWPKRENGKEDRLNRSVHLAEVLKEAMLPRATIRKNESTVGQLPVSIAADKFWRWLRPLQEPGNFHLWALQSRQTLQLDPGDRLLLALKKNNDGTVSVALPSYLEARPDLAVSTRVASADGTVRMTVPRNSLTQQAGRYDLDLTATLEKPVYDRPHLHRELPLFAWFEVEPQSADRRPTSLRVENLLLRPAPAWALTAAAWPPERGESSVAIAPALPRVAAYWLGKEPPATATLEFTSLNVADRELKEKDRKFAVDTGNVEIEQLSPPTDGYLTIRLNHSEKKPVVVRVSVQGVSQSWTLGEDHKFFGNSNRYTATFGPIRAEDLERRLTLKFYSIASIKEHSTPAIADVGERPGVNNKDRLPEEKLD